MFLLRMVSDSDTGGEDVAASLRFRVRLPPGPFLWNADCRLHFFKIWRCRTRRNHHFSRIALNPLSTSSFIFFDISYV